MFQELRASLVVLVFFTVLTGFAYPFAVTAAGHAAFPHQAGGSLINGKDGVLGSELIGQPFTGDKYFHSRPSAAGAGYDAVASGGSNLAPSSPDLIKTITERVAQERRSGEMRPIPVDLVTASGSGLDPEISVAAASYQLPHIAEVRGIPVQQVQALITRYTTPPLWGVWGEARVNVLALNRALDQLTAPAP